MGWYEVEQRYDDGFRREEVRLKSLCEWRRGGKNTNLWSGRPTGENISLTKDINATKWQMQTIRAISE